MPHIHHPDPSLVEGFKKAFTTKPKTDIVDAKIIAERVRFGKLNPVTPNDLKLQPLARLTRLRYHLTARKFVRLVFALLSKGQVYR
ncbi:MAG: transposase [Firmicutes bacterium]|nr:transposase [Bacillota bacterium]